MTKKVEALERFETTANAVSTIQPHLCGTTERTTSRIANPIDSDSDKLCVNSIFPLEYDFGQRIPPIFNCTLVKSIRAKHANLSMIAEYEENDLLNSIAARLTSNLFKGAAS